MQLLTISQVAEQLATTKSAVVSILNRGLLNWIDVSAKSNSKKPRKRILASDLIAFIECRRQAQTVCQVTHRVRHRRLRNVV